MGASRHARHGQDSHRFGARATVLPEKRRIQRCEKRYTELKRTKVLMRDAAIENSEVCGCRTYSAEVARYPGGTVRGRKPRVEKARYYFR